MHSVCPTHPDTQRGMIVVLAALSLVMLLGFTALAIDLGTVYMTRGELQRTADAAAVAAASQLDPSDQTVSKILLAEAVQYASLNTALSEAVLLDPNTDIQVGSFDDDEGVFTPGLTPANAVRVRARRTSASPSGPTPLQFMGVFGKQTADVEATAIAMLEEGNCFSSQGIVAREVSIAAQAELGGMCVYGRDNVKVASQAVALSDTYIGSLDESNIFFSNGLPPGFSLEDDDLVPTAADNVAATIDGIEAGTLVDPGTNVVVVSGLPKVKGIDSFDVNTLMPDTAYIFNDDVTFTGGDITVKGVTLAVRGIVYFGDDTVLRNGASPGAGATALEVLSTVSIHFGSGAGLTGAELIAGVDVRFASSAKIYEGRIEAGRKVHLAGKMMALDGGYETRYGTPVAGGGAVLVQ